MWTAEAAKYDTVSLLSAMFAVAIFQALRRESPG
jgi:hypothetical protein